MACSAANWENYGSGNGYKHQQMSKEQPAYAAEFCGITLRNRYDHYGPIKTMAAEVVRSGYDMLLEVKRYIDQEGEAIA